VAEECGAVYDGEKFAKHRGTRCQEVRGHEWLWHAAILEDGEPLHWRETDPRQLELGNAGVPACIGSGT
jgi:hypothetical protein